MEAAARRERKVVSVLFADLVGFTQRAEELDPEDVEAILRPYHERLRSELERFGGTPQNAKHGADYHMRLPGVRGPERRTYRRSPFPS
jgi:class 3 adenylate cyclase